MNETQADKALEREDILSMSRKELEERILRCTPTLLFVEHDRAFCDRVATASLVLSEP